VPTVPECRKEGERSVSALGRFILAVLALLLTSGASPALANHGVDVDNADIFDFFIIANDRKVGAFPYDTTLTNFDPDAGWLEGDRVAYRCAYTFLQNDGEIVARVTFTRPDQAAAYTVLNDRYMHEGERHYDGFRAGVQQVPDDQCPRPTEPYEALGGNPPIPRIEFSTPGGQTLEVRDYRRVATRAEGTWCCGEVADPGHDFAITSATPKRVTVTMYQDRLPVMVVYYDRLSPNVRLTSNFVAPSPSLSPGPSPTTPPPQPSSPELTADIDGDGDVDFTDLAAFVEAWFEEVE
jgi:hypothetical protein